MALGGYILYCVVYFLTVLFPTWSSWMLLLAAFLKSIGGGAWMMLMASYAYMADISTEENRTTRMTVMMFSKGFGMSAGTALGPILYDSYGYALVYLVAILLFTICIIWSYFVVPHKPNTSEDYTKRKSTCERIMTIPRKLK
ncbi:unnamed protein product, partial [Meganyctiphanes norvegica]